MTSRDLLAQLNLANQLTFLRLVAVPFFVLALLQGRFGVALGLFVGAAVTDLLDGLTARRFGGATRLGTYLDPAADKLLLTAGFVMLTEYPKMFSEIGFTARLPLWLTVLTISRDVLIVGVVLVVYLAYGQTRFQPSGWGKLATVWSSVTVGVFLLFNVLGRSDPTLDIFVWVQLALTLISGFHYLGRTMRMLGRRDPAAEPQG